MATDIRCESGLTKYNSRPSARPTGEMPPSVGMRHLPPGGLNPRT